MKKLSFVIWHLCILITFKYLNNARDFGKIHFFFKSAYSFGEF